MNADKNVHEGKQPVDDNSVMSFSMEGMLTQKDSSLLATAWAPRWNSNQAISKFQAEVNGELKQGHAGVHLIARSNKGSPYNTEQLITMDGPFEIRLVMQIFGSDSLSSHSAAIQKRMCDAYLSLCPSDAREMGVVNGDLVSIGSNENGATLPLYIRKETPVGVALVYAGSSALGARINPHDLPQYASLAPSKAVYDAIQSRLGLTNLVVNDAAAGAH
jgi:NADH-quinone oxidoreductase subunit G